MAIDDAKADETRQRRIVKTVALLREGRAQGLGGRAGGRCAGGRALCGPGRGQARAGGH
jgi:hypothetical protein